MNSCTLWTGTVWLPVLMAAPLPETALIRRDGTLPETFGGNGMGFARTSHISTTTSSPSSSPLIPNVPWISSAVVSHEYESTFSSPSRFRFAPSLVSTNAHRTPYAAS